MHSGETLNTADNEFNEFGTPNGTLLLEILSIVAQPTHMRVPITFLSAVRCAAVFLCTRYSVVICLYAIRILFGLTGASYHELEGITGRGSKTSLGY
jgi:hypothetical protein